MHKERETNKERTKETESKKLTEIYDFIKSLNNREYTTKEFNKRLILFFGVSDFRVVATKTKLMETLDLITIKDKGWGDKTIWINENPSN